MHDRADRRGSRAGGRSGCAADRALPAAASGRADLAGRRDLAAAATDQQLGPRRRRTQPAGVRRPPGHPDPVRARRHPRRAAEPDLEGRGRGHPERRVQRSRQAGGPRGRRDRDRGAVPPGRLPEPPQRVHPQPRAGGSGRPVRALADPPDRPRRRRHPGRHGHRAAHHARSVEPRPGPAATGLHPAADHLRPQRHRGPDPWGRPAQRRQAAAGQLPRPVQPGRLVRLEADLGAAGEHRRLPAPGVHGP